MVLSDIMKIDPYNHEKKYRNWQKKTKNGIPGISKANSCLILKYLHDMEYGINVSAQSKKGGRSYIRLNTIREKMLFFAKKFKETYNVDDIAGISEEQVVVFFSKMRKGEILRKDGKRYISVDCYVNVFKAFWHWYQIVNRKQRIEIPDITVDLDTSREKPKWVYLTEEQIRKLCDNARPEYKVLIMFLYDTGIRSPGELINIKVSDLYENFRKLHIRDEIVKKGSFGRKINLMLCSDLLKRYVADKNLQNDDQLFKISPPVVNRYLRRLAERVFGEDESLAGDKYSHLTMYDFRHCACCYWLPRYKSESALKYRFGWRKSDKIHYYSELLGMKDTITEEDMLMDFTKTEIEKRLLKTEQENDILKEKIEGYEKDITQVKDLMKIYVLKLKDLEEKQILFGS